MAVSTPHSGTSDGSVPVPGLADVDGCSKGGVSVAEWATISAGGDEVGLPEGEITTSELRGLTDPGLSRIGYTVGAELAGSKTGTMGNLVGSVVLEGTGSETVREVVGLGVLGSTLHSGTSDGWSVRVIPVPRLVVVDGCSNRGVPAGG